MNTKYNEWYIHIMWTKYQNLMILYLVFKKEQTDKKKQTKILSKTMV